MKVVENTDARLVVADEPWAMYLILIGVMVAGAGLFRETNSVFAGLLGLAIISGAAWLLWSRFPFRRYVFDLDAGSLTRRESRLGLRRSHRMDLSRIRGVQQEVDRVELQAVSRLVLLTEDGPEPLTHSFTAADLSPVETAIRDWLAEQITRSRPD